MGPTRLAMLAILFVALAVTIPAAPQSSSSNAIAAEAAAAYDAKDWAKAARLYAELSQSPEAPPRVWLRLGAALRELGKYQDALAAYEKANAAGAALFGEYGEAAVYAAMKQQGKGKKLAHDPDPVTARALVDATQDKNWLVRVAALEAIAERGDRSLISKVAPSLDDDKDDVRYTGAACIARLSAMPAKHRISDTSVASAAVPN